MARHLPSKPAGIIILLTLLALALISTVPTLAGPSAQPTILISIIDHVFMPQNLSVSVGANIVWTNNGTVAHTVTSDTGLWDSGPLLPSQTFSRRFDAPGTYYYHCEFHRGAGMVGVITVTGAALPTPTGTVSPTVTTTVTGTVTATVTTTPAPFGATPTPTPAIAPGKPTPAPSTPLPVPPAVVPAPGATPFPSTLPATGETALLPWAVVFIACLLVTGLVLRTAGRR